MFELTIRQRIVALVLLVFLGIGGLLLFLNNNGHYAESYRESTSVNKIFVHICGAVARPGIICLKPGTRKFEALKLAGGTLSEADLNQVNLAEFVLDGEQIYVPRKGEVIKISKGNQKSRPQKIQNVVTGVVKPSMKWPLDVNTVSATEIDNVPGIGPALASRIIDYRTRYGRFQKIEDLLKVNGIGATKLEKFRSFLCVK